jgi:GT2 family glycosyltransferase
VIGADVNSAVDRGRVSISVVSHGHAASVATLLEDIAANVRTEIEVILTLNVPEALSFDPARFPFPVRLVQNSSPKGFGANHNAAFRASRGGHYCVLNPDIRIERDPFPDLIERFQDRLVGVAAPLIRNPAGAVEDSARRFPTFGSILRKALLRRTKLDYLIGDELIYPDWVAGMFMVFPRAVFEETGGFDERYFLYYEDVDLCARLAIAGRRAVLCPRASAVHAAQRESRRSLRYLRWHLSSMLRFFLSYPAKPGQRS